MMTDYFPIDTGSKYMFTCYMKRHTPTNPYLVQYLYEGQGYFGLGSHVKYTSGSEQPNYYGNPYFYYGDLGKRLGKDNTLFVLIFLMDD